MGRPWRTEIPYHGEELGIAPHTAKRNRHHQDDFMREERRQARRARVPGLRITYESAAGATVEADALDVGAGGVFLRSAAPLSVGQRLSLEIGLAADATRWSALGRVVWTRASDTADGPAGMGVKFIDADDAAIALIARLVETRERTDPGTGAPKMPAREPTMVGMGVGVPEKAPLAAVPIVAVAPKRERTMLGVGLVADPPPPVEPQLPPTAPVSSPQVEPPADGWDPPASPEPSEPLVIEPSIAIELVAKRPDPLTPPPEPPAPSEPRQAAKGTEDAGRSEEPAAPSKDAEPRRPEEARPSPPEEPRPFSERSLAAAGVPRRRRWIGWVLLLLLVGGGAGVYAYRSRIPWHRMRAFVERHLGRQ